MSPPGRRVSSGQPTAGAPGPHSARPSAGRSRSTRRRPQRSTWAPRTGSRRPSTEGRRGNRPTRASSRPRSSRRQPTRATRRSCTPGPTVACSAATTAVAPGRRSSSEPAVQAVAVDPTNSAHLLASGSRGILISTNRGPHLGEGRRQHANPRRPQRLGPGQRDRVRPTSPGHRVRRRLGSRRDPKQRRWHHLAPNRTPPRLDLDRNDRRRPTRIRDALRQLQRCAPPQHRWGLLLEMALPHSSVQSWEYSQSIPPTRRRSTPRSATPPAGFAHRIWPKASTAASTGDSSSRERTTSTPPHSPSSLATRTRCTQRQRSRASCRQPTAEPPGDRSTQVSWRARSARVTLDRTGSTLYAGTNGAGLVQSPPPLGRDSVLKRPANGQTRPRPRVALRTKPPLLARHRRRHSRMLGHAAINSSRVDRASIGPLTTESLLSVSGCPGLRALRLWLRAVR